jgi:Family of unknown function (DUF6057)
MGKNKLLKYIEYLSTGLFFAGVFIFFAFFYNNHLHFEEQTQLFLLTGDYFISKIGFPGGFSGYIGGFLTQFYYLSLVGPLILILLIFAIQQLTKHILFTINQNRSFFLLSFLPALNAAMIMCDEFYPFSAIIGFIIALLSGLLYINVKTDKYRFISGLILIPLTYWLAGGSYLMFFSMALVFEFITFLRSRREEPSIKIKDRNIKLIYNFKTCYFIVSLVFAAGIPILVKRYLILQPIMLTYMSEFYYNLRITIPIAIPVLFLLLPVLMVMIFLFPATEKRYKIALGAQFGLLFIATWLGFRAWANFGAEKIMTYDYLVRNDRWNEVIQFAEKNPPMNDLSLAMLNLSLAKTGQLGNKMFNYNQHNTGGLFLPFGREYVAPLMGNEIFYNLSLINASQEYAFESMETIPSMNKSARIIKRLAETNLINGNYKVSEKYLKLLEKTMFYRKWAKETMKYLYNDDLINKHPDWGEKRKFMIKEDFFFNVRNIESYLNMMLKENPQNKIAFEYLMAFYMINKDLRNFMNCIPMMEKMNYKELPISYQEAIMYIIGLSTKNPMANTPSYISENIKNRMKTYAGIYTTYPDAKERLNKNFSGTYWYYLHFKPVDIKNNK